MVVGHRGARQMLTQLDAASSPQTLRLSVSIIYMPAVPPRTRCRSGATQPTNMMRRCASPPRSPAGAVMGVRSTDAGGTHTGEGQSCLPEQTGNKLGNEPHGTVDRMAPQEGLNHPRVASSLSPEGVQLLCNRQPASRPCVGDPPTWFWVGHPWSCST